jgi:hypothetical protein
MLWPPGLYRNSDTEEPTSFRQETLIWDVPLSVLNLNRTKVTDDGLEHLKGMTSLRRLLLQRTKVTDAGVRKLQQALPNCKIEH